VAITWIGNVAVVAPELLNKPVALQNLILAAVDRQVGDDEWGSMADDGRTYLAAAIATLSPGYLTGETLGQMSRSYGMPLGITGELAVNKYGIYYMYLLRVAVGPGVVVP
jgi:hypothetical protein